MSSRSFSRFAQTLRTPLSIDHQKWSHTRIRHLSGLGVVLLVFLTLAFWIDANMTHTREQDHLLELILTESQHGVRPRPSSFASEQSSPNRRMLEIDGIIPLGVVVIAELRPCAGLVPALMNALSNLPGWEGQVFYGNGNAAYIKQHRRLQALVKSGLVTLHLIDWDGLGGKPHGKGPGDSSIYSLVFKSTEFWAAMRAEKVLITQADARICTNSKRSIDDFLEYDYIGAPWPKGIRWILPDSLATKEMGGNELVVGNGGFSLRSKSAMLTVTSMKQELADIWSPHGLNLPNEDTFIVYALYWLNEHRNGTFKIASPQIAATFSLELADETIMAWSEGDAFGGHKPMRLSGAGWEKEMQRLCPDMIAVFKNCRCDECLFRRD